MTRTRPAAAAAPPTPPPPPPPPPATPGSARAKKIIDFFLGTGGVLLGALGVKEYLKSAAAKAMQPLVEPVTEDCRADLLDDFMKMPEADRANIEYWLAQDILANRENETVFLLSKIKKDATNGRRDTLKMMNAMPEAQFRLYLEMLNHDVLAQRYRRMRDKEWITKARREKLAAEAKKTWLAIDVEAGKFAANINDITTSIKKWQDARDKKRRK